MNDQFSRTQLLIGNEGIEKLRSSRVAVFGIGGVGGFTVEALARSGIGTIDLIDDDKVCLSNLNRQIIATRSTLGRYKVDAAEDRIKDIDPEIRIIKHRTFYTPEASGQFFFGDFDYVVDAIDTVTGKISLVLKAQEAGVPIISCMGAGNKMDPTAFEVADIYSTSICPLARVMRRELKKRGVKSLKVVYSKEAPAAPSAGTGASANPGCADTGDADRPGSSRRSIPGSISFVPSVAGLIIAGEVIKDLIKR